MELAEYQETTFDKGWYLYNSRPKLELVGYAHDSYMQKCMSGIIAYLGLAMWEIDTHIRNHEI